MLAMHSKGLASTEGDLSPLTPLHFARINGEQHFAKEIYGWPSNMYVTDCRRFLLRATPGSLQKHPTPKAASWHIIASTYYATFVSAPRGASEQEIADLAEKLQQGPG